MNKKIKIILMSVLSAIGLVMVAGVIKFNFFQDDINMADTGLETNKDGPSVMYSNQISDDRTLLVLSAPSVHDEYYKPAFQKIVDFQIEYANKILGNDNVIIVVDKDTKKYYEGKVPEDVLLTDEIHDIWMRDFTTINPFDPVQFIYTWASMAKAESKEVQNSFKYFADNLGIERKNSDLIIDGGNIVDNYNGKVITTTRFLEDNKLEELEAKNKLKGLLHATEVAILEPDENALAHADGMVAWLDNNTLLVNDYSEEPEYRKVVMDELRESFPNIKIIEVPVIFQEDNPGEWEGFNSSCGVNLNLVLTNKNLYVPTFGIANDETVLGIIQKNTSKKVIPIEAKKVCPMGGSVRCLTWQVTGANAEKLIVTARKK